jgi:hypothetical protein
MKLIIQTIIAATLVAIGGVEFSKAFHGATWATTQSLTHPAGVVILGLALIAAGVGYGYYLIKIRK